MGGQGWNTEKAVNMVMAQRYYSKSKFHPAAVPKVSNLGEVRNGAAVPPIQFFMYQARISSTVNCTLRII